MKVAYLLIAPLKTWQETSVEVQGLRLHSSTAGSMGLISGLGNKDPICCTLWSKDNKNYFLKNVPADLVSGEVL